MSQAGNVAGAGVVSEAGAGAVSGRSPAGRDVDVVVVGGGHNGLVCAAYLARAGVDTLLVEARDTVGGCASTVSDLDARFNICSCDHTMVRAMPFIDDLDLAAHGLRYLEADPSTVYMDHGGNPPWLFFNDSERTIESIGRHRPAQAKAYRRYLADARPVAELALEMGTGPASTPRMLARVLARRGRGGVRLLQWSRASALDVLRSYFDDEALVMPGISNGPTIWGAPPDAAGTGLAGSFYAMRHMVKTGRPVGGSGALTDALAASFQAAGGRLSCGTPVNGLLGDGGGVTGVRPRRRNRGLGGERWSRHATRWWWRRSGSPIPGAGPLAASSTGPDRRLPVTATSPRSTRSSPTSPATRCWRTRTCWTSSRIATPPSRTT